jgi:uncharacterized protein
MMIALFLSLCISNIKAQTGTQTEKLIKELKEKDLTNALKTVQNIDNVNYKDSDGFTILMYASSIGSIDICRILLDKGAQLDLQDIDDATALILASINGHTEGVRLLLEKGANPDLKDNEGKTAINYAKKRDVKTLLTTYMKK